MSDFRRGQKVYDEVYMTWQDMEFHIQWKAIKHIYMTMDSKTLVVSLRVPKDMPKEAIFAFMKDRLPWLETHRERFKRRQEEGMYKTVYEEGALHYLWGKTYPLVFKKELTTQGKGPSITLHFDGSAFIVQGPSMESAQSVLPELFQRLYKAKLEALVPELLEECEQIVGTSCKEWRSRFMKTRWGTCNIGKRRICLNSRLALYDPDCLRYVIIHELCHLYEASHNKRFYAFMDRFCPHWQQYREALKVLR